MTLIDAGRHQSADPAAPGRTEAEALIEEARRRQRRRRWVTGSLALLVATGGAIAAAASGGGRPTSRAPRSKTVPPSVPVTSVPPPVRVFPVLPLPAQFVAGAWSPKSPPAGMTAWGTELVVVSTRTSRVLRVLARGRLEVLAQEGRQVFFGQLPGKEESVIYEVSIAGGPVRRIGGLGGSLTPSPNGDFLAYQSDSLTDLDVRDVATGTTTSIRLRDLAPHIVDPALKSLAWVTPGDRFAALIVSNASGPDVSELVVVEARPHQPLVVVQTKRFAASMTWDFISRSAKPNTLLGGWVPSSGQGPPGPRVVQMTLSGRGVSLRTVGTLPASCAGGVDAIDPSGQHVLCSSNPFGIVRFVQGRYRIDRSISGNSLVITTATW
jgi:hypothetical protein